MTHPMDECRDGRTDGRLIRSDHSNRNQYGSNIYDRSATTAAQQHAAATVSNDISVNHYLHLRQLDFDATDSTSAHANHIITPGIS